MPVLSLVPERYHDGELANQYNNKRGCKMASKLKTGKNCDLHLRVNTQLKIYIANKAAENNKTINDYCTDILKNYKYANQLMNIEAIQKKKVRLLSNLANNLNQLAKLCNSEKEAPQKEMLLAMWNDLKAIR